MKGIMRIAAILVATFALCFALAGCSSGGDGADYTKNFAGDWKLSGIEAADESTTADDMAMLEAFGMTVTITLNEDGSAKFNLFGEEMSGTWKAKSATEATFTLEGDTATMTLADDTLRLDVSGEAMAFKRATA